MFPIVRPIETIWLKNNLQTNDVITSIFTSGDNRPPDELLRFKLKDESDSVSASMDGELIKL